VPALPFIRCEAVVPGEPRRAFELASDMESYPRFMKDVVSLRVLEREPGAQISEWQARFQGKILRWKERDVFDEAALTIRYNQTEGDLRKFEGAWTFEPTPDGTRVTLTCDFDLGIPMLSSLLDPVAKMVVRKNCEDMIAAVAAQIRAKD
jgi:ribosome-associated toxin RatA of RatAB toxin-antitoxin module